MSLGSKVSGPYAVLAAARTHVGLVRERNEDCAALGHLIIQGRDEYAAAEALIESDGFLAVLADGVGGSRGGSEAAKTAVSAMVSRQPDVFDAEVLRDAVMDASNSVRVLGATSETKRGCASTLAGVWLRSDGVFIFNVGDSRVFGIQRSTIQKLTVDDADPHDPRVLTRFMGSPHLRKRDLHISRIPASMFKRFVVCSDGLDAHTLEDSISSMTVGSPQELVDLLIKQTLSAGAPDNVTVAVVDLMLPEGPIA